MYRCYFFRDKTVADLITSILRMSDSFRSPDLPRDEILAWQISPSADPLGHAHDCLRGSPYRSPRLAKRG
jgi:hypothetical protein